MATVPTFDTWSAGENPTAAKLNTNIRDAGNFFRQTPFAYAYSTTGTSVPTAAYTTIALNAELMDTDAMHDTVTNNSRLTFKTAGLYHVIGSVSVPNNTTGARKLYLRVNGGVLDNIAEATGATVGGVTYTVACQGYFFAAVNDYVDIQAWQSSGGSLTTITGLGATFLQAKWVGA